MLIKTKKTSFPNKISRKYRPISTRIEQNNDHVKITRGILFRSSFKTGKLKLKLWWVGARERKMRAFLVPFILYKENFFNICVLSQCIVCWIHFQNIQTFTNQKTLLHTLSLLVFKTVESLQCILNNTHLGKNWVLFSSVEKWLLGCFWAFPYVDTIN